MGFCFLGGRRGKFQNTHAPGWDQGGRWASGGSYFVHLVGGIRSGGYQASNGRSGGITVLCSKLTIFRDTITFLLRPRVFSGTLGCVTRNDTACTPRRNCEPRSRSMARVLGLQKVANSRKITTGSRSDLLEPSRTKETPQF